jgi:oxygen-dependent protoporphyrinogen oxidase
MVMPDRDVIVVGAGISGLTTAFRLATRGIDVAVIEAGSRTGGVIETVQRDGALIECGPNSVLDTHPEIAGLIEALDLTSQRIETSTASARRFVVRQGQLVALPASFGAFLATPLFSPRAKLRLLREPFVSRAPAVTEEAVADFVVRRLGREFLDYAVEPFVAGIYAGDARRLSLSAALPRLHALEQTYGSLFVGQFRSARARAQRAERSRAIARSFSFIRGLQTLTDALAARLPVQTGVQAAAIEPAAGSIRVRIDVAGTPQVIRARAVVLSVPAAAAAALLRDAAPEAANALAAVPYAPVASVASLYRRADVAHALDGFGFLAPRSEHRRILGTLFSSSLFPERAAAGHVLVTTFVGGARDPGLASLADAQLSGLVEGELAALLGARTPVAQTITRRPSAIPQYIIGHGERMRLAERAQEAVPGLFLCASYRGGVAVGDCIASACRTAEIAARYLGRVD